MYLGQTNAAALKRYSSIDTTSRVEGATPHQLVKILFDELLLAMGAASAALVAGDRRKVIDKQSRALAILHALETSLDYDRGGDVAVSLAIVYREVRRRALESVASNDVAMLDAARGFIADIADAWTQIG
jgi:flagellar secretion chaperone FliS